MVGLNINQIYNKLVCPLKYKVDQFLDPTLITATALTSLPCCLEYIIKFSSQYSFPESLLFGTGLSILSFKLIQDKIIGKFSSFVSKKNKELYNKAKQNPIKENRPGVFNCLKTASLATITYLMIFNWSPRSINNLEKRFFSNEKPKHKIEQTIKQDSKDSITLEGKTLEEYLEKINTEIIKNRKQQNKQQKQKIGNREYKEQEEIETNFDNEKLQDVIYVNCNLYNLNPNLVKALIKIESSNDHSTVSKAGAKGFMQIMYDTAKELGIDRDNPYQNINGGCKYLRQQLNKYKQDERLALAAYNAGPGNVDKAIKKAKKSIKTVEYKDIEEHLPKETQNYVKKINSIYTL